MDNQDLAKHLEALLGAPEGVSIGSGTINFSSQGRSATVDRGNSEEAFDLIVNRRRRSRPQGTTVIVRYLFVHEEGDDYVLYLGGDSDGAVEIHRQPAKLPACPEDDPPQEIPEEGGWSVFFSGDPPYPREDNWQCRSDNLTLAKATMPMPKDWPSGAALEFYSSYGQALDINGNYVANLDARFSFGGSWSALSNEHDFELFRPTRRRDSNGNFRNPAWYMMRISGTAYYPDGFFPGADYETYPGQGFWVAYGPRNGEPPPPIRGIDTFEGWTLGNTSYELDCGWYPPDDPPDEAFRGNPINAWLAPTANKSYIEIRGESKCDAEPDEYKMIYLEYDHSSKDDTKILEADRVHGRLKQEDYKSEDWRSRSQQKDGQEACFDLYLDSTYISTKSNNSYRFVNFGAASENPDITIVELLLGETDETISEANIGVTPISVKTETASTDFGDVTSESCDFEDELATTYPCECYPAGDQGDFDPTKTNLLTIVPFLIEA